MVRPKLLALDLDETTLDAQGRLAPENRRALEAAIAQGIQVVVATGRAVTALPEDVCGMPGIRYAITGNGAAVWDLAEKKALRRYLLPQEAAEAVLRIAAGEPVAYEATVAGQPYAGWDYIRDPDKYLTDGRTADYIQRTRRGVADITAFIRQHSMELDSLNLVVDSLARKQRLMERLRQLDGVYITTSAPRLIEISNGDSGKHRGLQFLAEYLGLRRQDTAAFGNADNDAEMLAWAGTGVAVQNATPGCLAAADYVTDGHDEAGVAKALKALWGI